MLNITTQHYSLTQTNVVAPSPVILTKTIASVDPTKSFLVFKESFIIRASTNIPVVSVEDPFGKQYNSIGVELELTNATTVTIKIYKLSGYTYLATDSFHIFFDVISYG